MSIWDDFTDFISTSSGVGAVLLGGAVLGSAVISSSANRRAADVAANTAAAQTAEIRRANEAAQARFDAMQTAAEPGVTGLRAVALQTPATLTPEQQAGYEDINRAAVRTASAGGLRGSGRATTAIINKAQSDFRNRAIADNRARQDAAQRSLSQPFFSAGTGAANVDVATGRDIAGITGRAGETAANLETAQGGVYSSALSDIAAVINDKTKKRESRYGASEDEDEKFRDQVRRDYGYRAI
jgi:hypothetical protein